MKDQETAVPVTFLELELTGKCQLDCVMCYSDSGPSGTHGTMMVRDWERLIDDAAAMGIRTVQFIGGEATLYPALPRLVRHAVAAGLRVEVFSNLVHVTPAQWAAFSLPGVSLATSWFTVDPAVHAQITGRGGAHARTKANIAEAVRRGIPVRAGMVDAADGDAGAARAELASLGVAGTGVADRVRRIGRAALRGPAGDHNVAELCGRCGRGMAAVSPEGDVWPCVMSRWLPAGNVLREGLGAVLAGPRWQAVVAGIPVPRTGGDPCNPDQDGNDCRPAETLARRRSTREDNI